MNPDCVCDDSHGGDGHDGELSSAGHIERADESFLELTNKGFYESVDLQEYEKQLVIE
jgi:hypothetical protein